MINLTLGELAQASGALLRGDPSVLVTGVSTDSRTCTGGELFVALPGERTDGHLHVADARDRGAVAVLGAREVAGPALLSPDPLAALGRIARAVLDRLANVAVTAVTGSSGKTGTKDLIGGLLARLGPTVAPAGSMNNEIGLPLTVLRCDTSTRHLVLEMGARGVGHIRYLCGIAPPQTAVVLNVGSAHLGEFGSRAAIAAAKAELVEGLAATAVAVLNADDPLVRAMAQRTAARVVLVGESADAAVRAEDVRLDTSGRASFDLLTPSGSAEVRLRLVGEHHVANSLAAAAVACEQGMGVDAVAEALSRAEPVSRWRMEVRERADGLVVVNDAYNANPESMRAALSTLAAMAGGRRTWAVLGEMRELGEASISEHDAIGRLAVRLGVDRLVAVGESARPIQQGASLEGAGPGGAQWVPDVAEALRLLGAEAEAHDIVLVKASRALGLERVAAGLLGEDVAT